MLHLNLGFVTETVEVSTYLSKVDQKVFNTFEKYSSLCNVPIGGLIDDSKNVKNAVVVGVTSFVKTYNGKHKCDTNQPQVFVNVAKYLPWIYDMMKRI